MNCEVDALRSLPQGSSLVYYYKVLQENDNINESLLEFHCKLGESVLKETFNNNATLKKSYIELYRTKFNEVFKFHNNVNDTLVDDDVLLGNVNVQILRVTREYQTDNFEDYRLVDIVIREVAEKFNKSILDRNSE